VVEEGYGVLNIGVGEKASLKIGKSSLFEHIVYSGKKESLLNIDE